MQPSFLRGMRQDIHKKEYKKRNRINSFFKRAGDGNRTHVSSLEGWCSTIELHPHVQYFVASSHRQVVYYHNHISMSTTFLFFNAQFRNRTRDTRIFSPLLYQLS